MTVSVAICTYNGEKYIKKQLESIIRQTRIPDEIILYDDNSTDKTIEIADETLKKSDIQYKIHKNIKNMGCKDNFLNCYHECIGDVIFSCDQDDIWVNDKIEKFMKHFETDKKLVLAFCNAELIDSNDNSLNITLLEQIGVPQNQNIDINFYKNRLFGDTFGNFLVYGCCYAFKRDFFKKLLPFPPKWYFDSWIAICAPLYGNICYINESLIFYRQHSNNYSGSVVGNNQVKITAFEKIRNTSFDKYFKTPKLYYEFYSIYNDWNKGLLSDEDSIHIKKSIRFYYTLKKIGSVNRLFGCALIIKQFFCGDYKHYRGNYKLLIFDILYILFRNKNILE